MIKKIALISLLLLATYQSGLDNTSTSCTEAQLSGGFINIVLGGTEQCIALTCLNQQPYFASAIDQSVLLSFTPQFENVEVTLSSLAAICPSSNANCLEDSCIEMSVKHNDDTPITAKNSGNMLENFTFDFPLADLNDGSKCRPGVGVLNCSITVEYKIKGMTSADINTQTIQFEIGTQTSDLVKVSFDTPSVIVECVGGTGNCEGGDDGSGDLTFITTCAGPISNIEGNIGFQLEYRQNDSSQYLYYFYIKYNIPYSHNPDCFDQVVTLNDKKLEDGDAEYGYIPSSMRSSYGITKENMEAFGCKKTTNDDDGSISYDCTLKVEFFLKGTTTLQYSFLSNQKPTVSADETALNSVEIETITLKNVEQELAICDNIACDNELSAPFSYFLNETIYVKQSMSDPSYTSKYLDIQSVKVGGKQAEISEKDSSVSGTVIYGFRPLEISLVDSLVEVTSKLSDTAPISLKRVLSVTPTITHTYAIQSDIIISEFKELPVPIIPPSPPTEPPAQPPANPDGSTEDDGDDTGLIVVIVLVSILFVGGVLLGVFKYLQSIGKFGKGGEAQVIPQNNEENKGICDTNVNNDNMVELEVEKQTEKPEENAKEKEIQITKTELDNEKVEGNEENEGNV